MLSIKRFVAPVYLNGEFAEAYITVKETVGSKIYSLELDELKNPSDTQGSTLPKDRYHISEGYNKLLRKVEKARDFQKNIRFSVVPEDENLVVVHNVTPDKLRKAGKLGGMPVPSLG